MPTPFKRLSPLMKNFAGELTNGTRGPEQFESQWNGSQTAATLRAARCTWGLRQSGRLVSQGRRNKGPQTPGKDAEKHQRRHAWRLRSIAVAPDCHSLAADFRGAERVDDVIRGPFRYL